MFDILHLLSTHLAPADALVLASPIWAVFWRASLDARSRNVDEISSDLPNMNG